MSDDKSAWESAEFHFGLAIGIIAAGTTCIVTFAIMMIALPGPECGKPWNRPIVPPFDFAPVELVYQDSVDGHPLAYWKIRVFVHSDNTQAFYLAPTGIFHTPEAVRRECHYEQTQNWIDIVKREFRFNSAASRYQLWSDLDTSYAVTAGCNDDACPQLLYSFRC